MAQRAVAAGMIGEYRKMLRMCAQSAAACERTFINIKTSHTGTSKGSLVAPSEYEIDVVGFQTTKVSDNEYSSSSFENMPYRILAKKPGYLTDIITWYHQGGSDGQSI